jgi:hypothetical protein
MFNKIRKFLVKKLIHSEDGYTFTGFSGTEPIKFYYQEDTGKYLIGNRCETMYYFEPTLSGWSSYSSRYLPWGQTVERWNPATKKIESFTYNEEPHEIKFSTWRYGILEMIHKQYIDSILSMSPEELVETQDRIRAWRNTLKELKNYE